MEINEEKRIENVINEITRLSENRDWKLIKVNTFTNLISFEKEFEYSSKPVRLDVYWKKDSSQNFLNLTIATAMNHPTKGKTQLFRKGVNNSGFIKLLKDPRQHTGRGYYTKNGK